MLVGSSIRCDFPEHTFFEEDCFNQLDDDRNGLVDCEDEACKGKVLCVPPVPSAYGWSGPVVIWLGHRSETPPACAATEDVHDWFGGEPDETQFDPDLICPACTCSNSGTPRCESRLRLYEDSSCQTPIGSPEAVHTVTNRCLSIAIDSPPQTNYYVRLEPPTVSSACSAQTTQPASFPPVDWELKLRACDVRELRRTCGQQSCLDVPAAPFAPRVCVYKPTDSAACPPGYPELQAGYGETVDDRRCSECSCTSTGFTCSYASTSMGDFGTSSDCGQQRYAIPFNPGCLPVEKPLSNPLNVKFISPIEPIANGTPAGCVASAVARTITGAVSRGEPVAVCCTSP